RDRRFVEGVGRLEVLDLGIAVDRDVGKVGEHLRGPVLPRAEVEELGCGVDERRGGFSGAERFVVDDVFQERNVRLYSANTEFGESAVHPVEREVEGGGESGDFYEERIVK